jgi:hypothetical protein
MSLPGDKTYKDFTLPDSVVTKRDLYRLLKELETVDGKMIEADVRIKANIHDDQPIGMTDQLMQFIQQNDLSLQDGHERSEILKQVRLLKDKVAVFSVTLAQPVNNEHLMQLIGWLRNSIHPQVVLAVGLQPSLVSGAYVRTANQVFDFSFKSALERNRSGLLKELSSLGGGAA